MRFSKRHLWKFKSSGTRRGKYRSTQHHIPENMDLNHQCRWDALLLNSIEEEERGRSRNTATKRFRMKSICEVRRSAWCSGDGTDLARTSVGIKTILRTCDSVWSLFLEDCDNPSNFTLISWHKPKCSWAHNLSYLTVECIIIVVAIIIIYILLSFT